MVSTETIKTEFSYVKAWTGNSEVYHNTVFFKGHGEFCDVYFKSKNKGIKQAQIDTYNDLKSNYDAYLTEIEDFIMAHLKPLEKNKVDEIRKAPLLFDVIEVAYENDNYDLVLVCGKTFKNFIFFKKSIDLRVEFKNGRIQSIQRKRNVTEDNE